MMMKIGHKAALIPNAGERRRDGSDFSAAMERHLRDAAQKVRHLHAEAEKIPDERLRRVTLEASAGG